MPSYQTIFFVISLGCSLPVLYWYYRRNPHPRFRPKLGEMAMVSLFAVLLSLGGSLLIGGMMDDPERFTEDTGMGVTSAKDYARGEQRGNQREEREERDRRGDSSKKSSGSRERDSGGERR